MGGPKYLQGYRYITSTKKVNLLSVSSEPVTAIAASENIK